MSNETVLQLLKEDGSVVERRVALTKSMLELNDQQLIAVSDNIAQLTRLRSLSLTDNALTAIPAGVLAMTQLTELNLTGNRLAAIPPEIGRLMALTELFLVGIALVAVPREIGRLTALERLLLNLNALTAVPLELGRLPSLRLLFLNDNRLTWLPMELDRLPPTTCLFLNGNPLPIDVGGENNFTDSRSKLPKIFAATTALAMIRDEATTLAIGLQDLSLPALVTLEIIDAAFPNSIAMHRKWNLVTAVKHFHERQ